MHEWHTRGYQYDLVVQTMDFLAPDWRHQLIGITTEVFQITMDGLISSSSAEDKEAYENIVSMIANFSLQMVVGISKVCTEYDNRNNLGDQSPPILPLDLCALLSRYFVSCLQEQRIRFRQKFQQKRCSLCRTMRKQVLLFNLLESVGVHSEASLNTCRGFVGPSQALCQVQVALSLISP